MDQIYIIIYIILWAIVFISYQRKRKTFDCGTFVLAEYLILGIFSYFLYGDGYYGYQFRGLSLFNFFYLFFLLLVATLPLMQYDGRGKGLSKPPMQIIKAMCLLFIVSSLISVESTISNFRSGIFLLMTSDEGGSDLYREALEANENMGHGGFSHIFSVIITAFTNICAFFLFYLIRNYKENKLIIWALAFSYVLLVMQYISMGTRGSVVELFFIMVGSYLIFKPFYEKKIVKTINRVLLISTIVVSVPLVAITTSRFMNTSMGAGSSTVYYAGQSNLYFNKYALDDNGIRYGDRVMPLFKRMAFIDNVPHNFWERRDKYPHLKINDEVFVTYAGDFLIDFGPILGGIILCFWAFLFLQMTKNKGRKMSFSKLIILHLIICNCTIGAIKLFPYSDVGGNLQLIVYFITIILFSSVKQKRIA